MPRDAPLVETSEGAIGLQLIRDFPRPRTEILVNI